MPAVSFPTSPTVGQQVTVNGKIYTWNGKVWDSSVSTTSIFNLDDLLDVSVSGVINGNVLRFNGSNWVPGSASTSLSGLSDVNVTGVVTNNYLQFNGTRWVPGTVATPSSSLSSLTDVNVTGAVTNNMLIFNGTRWVPQTANINFLTDVDTITTAPTSGSYLRWNGSNWVPQVFPNIPNSIDNLSDVNTTTTTPVVNNILRWDGTNWVPQTANINFLSDVDTVSITPVSGNTLAWNGTNWVPQTANINFLSDVDTTTTGPSLNNVLTWNGTNWVPGSVITSMSVSSLTDASISSPADGQILRYSSSTSKWINSNESSGGGKERFRNRIINGDFKVQQRVFYGFVAPAAATTKFFNCDRWYMQQNNTNAWYQCRANMGGNAYLTNAGEIRTHMFIQARSIQTVTSTQLFGFHQDIEAYNLEDFNLGFSNAKPMILSFWARANQPGEYPVSLNIGTSYSFVSSYTITQATVDDSLAFQYFSIPIPAFTTAQISSLYNSYFMKISFGLGVGSNFRTATSNSWVAGEYYANNTSVNLTDTTMRAIWFSKVQLEKGSVASAFEVVPYDEELLRCQRYYHLIDSTDANDGSEKLFGDLGSVRSTTTQGTVRVTHPVTMRVSPVITQTGNATAKDLGSYTSNATLLSSVSRPNMSELTFTLATAGTALRPIYFYTAANSGRIEFNAE